MEKPELLAVWTSLLVLVLSASAALAAYATPLPELLGMNELATTVTVGVALAIALTALVLLSVELYRALVRPSVLLRESRNARRTRLAAADQQDDRSSALVARPR